ELSQKTLTILQRKLAQAGDKSAVVFLGDNTSRHGLPEAEHPHRATAEAQLMSTLRSVDGYDGSVAFIPGEYDWDQGGSQGYANVLNQEEFIENFLDNESAFLPGGGCPGPHELSLSETVTLIVIDTQWFLHPGDKTGIGSGCEAKTTIEVIEQLEDILTRNRHKQIVVATHHPVHSYGPRGGRLPLKQHFFPFTALNNSLYLPLPIIGSLYPLYRKLGANSQDLNHYRYRLVREALSNLLAQHNSVVHVAAHERSLQHIQCRNVDYVVAGAVSKATYVKKGRYARFTASQTGFAQIDFLTNGEAWLSFWGISDTTQPLYRQRLLAKATPPVTEEVIRSLDYTDSTITREANTKYLATPAKERFYGVNYRKEWSLPTTFSYFDIGQEKGGLKVVKRGGGGQTLSLRLEAKDGRQYVLRSVDKYPERNIPPSLSSPFIDTMLGEVIAASHPYAALAIPPLAEAVGVHHTNPKIVYIPDDPRLGKYRNTHASILALFEERPDDDWSEADYFGNSNDIESTPKMLKDLQEDNDNEVDQRAFLRARLFDLIIGDWDRHADQWRWATQKKDTSDGRIFTPIPRDRDQAFFLNEGIFPTLVSRKFALPILQGFSEEVRDVTRQWVAQVQYLDRRLLTNLSYEDWQAEVATLQQKLTDEVIERGIQQMPDTVFEVSGLGIIRKLQQRRDDLPRYARAYYRFLAREVDVVGSDNKERFQVERLDDQRTRVVVHKLSKNKERVEQKLFDRTFLTDETQEIRLYGLGGEDDFTITGSADQGIKIRIIGGGGEDEILDESSVRGMGKKTLVYDKPSGSKLQASSETKDRRSRRSDINHYYWGTFKYNYFAPLITAAYNRDDGIFLGGGFLYKHHAFRKQPFAARHSLSAKYAFATNAYNFSYSGEFTDVVGKSDLLVSADVKAPNYVNNFFGLGNDSFYDPDAQDIFFYRYRFEEYDVSALLKTNFTPYQYLALGPAYRSVDVRATEDRFITEFNRNGLDEESVFERHEYAGVRLHYELNRLNNFRPLSTTGNGGLGGALQGLQENSLATRGLYWQVVAEVSNGINSVSSGFSQISSELKYLWSTRVPVRITLAARVGGGHIFSNNFEFFQAQQLGNL
ncbi:MAG: hypothetical protein AAF223_01925, partial [Bacteroidota bacterium]